MSAYKKDPISPLCNTRGPEQPQYQIKVLRRQVNETHYWKVTDSSNQNNFCINKGFCGFFWSTEGKGRHSKTWITFMIKNCGSRGLQCWKGNHAGFHWSTTGALIDLYNLLSGLGPSLKALSQLLKPKAGCSWLADVMICCDHFSTLAHHLKTNKINGLTLTSAGCGKSRWVCWVYL